MEFDHEHYPLSTHTYWNGRQQTDIRCRRDDCPGIARVQIEWAPDTGLNWVKCCCCGEKWNPGTRNY